MKEADLVFVGSLFILLAIIFGFSMVRSPVIPILIFSVVFAWAAAMLWRRDEN